MATDLHFLELLELATHLRNREDSSVQVTRALLERIVHPDSHLASYALVTPEDAMASAAHADEEIEAGN